MTRRKFLATAAGLATAGAARVTAGSGSTLTAHVTVRDAGQTVDSVRYLELCDRDAPGSVTVMGSPEMPLVEFLDRALRGKMPVTLVAVAEAPSL